MERISFNGGIAGAVDSRIGGRKENQDHYTYSDTPLGPLVVVCDGMGGGPAGKTASSLAADTIVTRVVASLPSDNPADVLDAAIRSANQALNDAIAENRQLTGMGTTCVCLLFSGGSAYIGHVGDSRCYQLRKHKIHFRTTDHSQVAELVKMGTLTEEQARISPYSNIITRAIGIQPMVQPEIDKMAYRRGDRFALMSDGIWGTVPESVLVAELTESSSAEATVSGLVERTDGRGQRKGGKHDNLTLAVVDVESKPAAEGKSWKRIFSVSLIICAVVALAVLGVLRFRNTQPLTAQASADDGTVPECVTDVIPDDIDASVGADRDHAEGPNDAESDAPVADVSEGADVSADAEGSTVTSITPSSAIDVASGAQMLLRINKTKQTLSELNDFWADRDTPKKAKPNQWNECHKARKALYDDALANLKALARNCDDDMKGRVNDIIRLMERKQSVIVMPDAKHGRTMRDGTVVINECIAKLNQLTNK